MLQREVSDSTWKETKQKKKEEQSLYQQTVAIDRWHSSTGNIPPQGNKTNRARCRWKRQRTVAKL